jgi:hypothetical protein
MDVFSHGLWSGVLAKSVNLSTKKPRRINPWLAAWWGVFPDVFAFGISFVMLFWGLITGTFNRSMIPNPDALEPASQASDPMFRLSAYLYNYSHSLVIFAIVVGGIVLIKFLLKKGITLKQLIPWEMSAWLLHILCDVPTHSYRFYPTPVFWPLWGWKFNGFSWGVWWFMLLDYGALITVFIIFYFKKKKITNSKL